MSSNYIKVTVCPGLNLRPSISFVDRMRVEADGRRLTEDVERKLTMVLAKKVFAPQIEYIEWEMNRLAEMPYNIGTFYEVEEFFRRIIADYDASHKQTVEMELETLIRKEERRFPEMQDQQAARHQIHAGGHGVHLHQPRQRHQPRAVHEVCQERV